MGARHRFVSNAINPLTHSLKQVKTIKFGALLFASAAALALLNALPVQSFPQWLTDKVEDGVEIHYNLNSVKWLPNGVKQIDAYIPSIKMGRVVSISCPRWRYTATNEWQIIAPGSSVEEIAYKLCGKS